MHITDIRSKSKVEICFLKNIYLPIFLEKSGRNMKVLVISVLLFVAAVFTKDYKRVCYYTNWSQYRWGTKKFLPGDIVPNLCTHINYAFASINEQNELDTSEYNDHKMYDKMFLLKKYNPKLKILVSVGGYAHEDGDQSPFSRVVNNDKYLDTFVSSTVTFLRKWKFDGLDLDWEYPAGRGNSPPGDKQKYTQLVQKLRDAFFKDALENGKERLLLTAAVPAGKEKVKKGYEVEKLGLLFDWINLMSYDFHGNWEDKTGHHTAMSSRDGSLTVPAAVDYWIEKGFPAERIVLGIATYGRTFKLADETENGLNARTGDDEDDLLPLPIKTADFDIIPAGIATDGYMPYYDICREKLTVVQDNDAKAPYGYRGKIWVSFDNEKSLIHKVRSQIKNRGLAGAMFWSLDMDDFNGRHCGKGTYPLINAVKTELSAPPLPPPIPTTGPLTTTTPIPPLPTTTKSSTKKATTKTPNIKKCYPVGLYKKTPGMQEWCDNNCPRFCPKSHCICPGEKKSVEVCVAAGAWKGDSSMTSWCETNCAAGFCPATHCSCYIVKFK